MQRHRVLKRGRGSAVSAPPRTARALRAEERPAPPRGATSSPAPATPGATMAPALWPCVSRILWLACLLPLAPTGVAAGKAPHGPAARPPQAMVRPGSLPGAGVAELAPCALRAPFSSPEPLRRSAEGTGPAGRREALSSLPSSLSPEVASPLEVVPRTPRFLLPPPDQRCPGNRAQWPVHPSQYLGNSQLLGEGVDNTGRLTMCRVDHHATAPQGARPSCPRSNDFCIKMSPYLENLSTLFVLAERRTQF